MKHKSRYFLISLIFSFMLYFLWLASIASDETSRLGYYGIAASFLISLVPALEAVFGRMDNPNELLFKVQQLTHPLQSITSNLALSTRLIPEAANTFEREIETKGLLLTLKKDSPALAQSLSELKIFASKALGVKPNETGSLLPAIVLSGDIQAQRDRLESDENAKQLIEKIKIQIEELLAKYGGFK